MSYRIGMWVMIALVVAQTGYYHLVKVPEYHRLLDKYSIALDEAVVVMTSCSNLLDRMNERITYLKGYISTACAPEVRDEMSWNR